MAGEAVPSSLFTFICRVSDTFPTQWVYCCHHVPGRVSTAKQSSTPNGGERDMCLGSQTVSDIVLVVQLWSPVYF